METLSREIEPMAKKNYEFERRQKKDVNWTFSDVQPRNNPI